jgi:hypothetical protein
LPDSPAGAPENFVRKTERKFWIDPDGQNRWVPTLNDNGDPRIEDAQGADESCTACGTPIRWLCYVIHPTRDVATVGNCCIRKVINALPADKQKSYREAVTNLNRAARNAERAKKGLPPIIGRKQRHEARLRVLEAAAGDPRIVGVRWFYNGNSHSLNKDVHWLLAELKAGRSRPGFQSALLAVLAGYGHAEEPRH